MAVERSCRRSHPGCQGAAPGRRRAVGMLSACLVQAAMFREMSIKVVSSCAFPDSLQRHTIVERIEECARRFCGKQVFPPFADAGAPPSASANHICLQSFDGQASEALDLIQELLGKFRVAAGAVSRIPPTADFVETGRISVVIDCNTKRFDHASNIVSNSGRGDFDELPYGLRVAKSRNSTGTKHKYVDAQAPNFRSTSRDHFKPVFRCNAI
jgi:hypothetical protein